MESKPNDVTPFPSKDVTPFPSIENQQVLEAPPVQVKKKDGSTNVFELGEEIKILLEIINDSIKIKIKYQSDTFSSVYNLKDLQEKNNYFLIYNNIEDPFNEICESINKDKYNIQKEENNIILNIDIIHENKKNIILFILDKNNITNEDKIKSLYLLAYKQVKENNDLKEDIMFLENKVSELTNKVNTMESLLSIHFNKININNERKSATIFDEIIHKNKIINDLNQVKLLKDWLPFKNKSILKCKLIYDAKIDGDNCKTFHSLCDGKKGTLTLISTDNNKKIGAFIYAPLPRKESFIIYDKKAFLFSLNYNEIYKSLRENNYWHIYSEGPHFGGKLDKYNISIKDNFLSSHDNYYYCAGENYDFGKRKSTDKHNFRVTDLEVFQIYE